MASLTVAPGTPLQHAFDQIAALPGGDSEFRTVFLSPGVHRLRQPLKLSKANSGVRVVGLGDAVVSGGVAVVGWHADVPFHPHLLSADISKETAGLETWPRNLWVGGRRAERSPLSHDLWTPWAQAQYSATADGYIVQSLSPLLWRNPETVEMVYTAQGSQWSESRCGVAGVDALSGLGVTLNGSRASNSSVLVRMKQPCWFNLVHKPCGQGTSRVARIENAGVLAQLRPGQWYCDWKVRRLYYAPLVGERAASLDVVMPVSNGLVRASPGLARLSIVNVTFEHDGWPQPNGGEGYVEQQSGALIPRGNAPPFKPASCTECWLWAPPNGSLHFEAPRNLSFLGCTFRHLGSASGVSLMGGAQGNLVTGDHFYDLSGSAVQIGRNDRWSPDTPMELRERHNRVEDSLVEWAANEVCLQCVCARARVCACVRVRACVRACVLVLCGWPRLLSLVSAPLRPLVLLG